MCVFVRSSIPQLSEEFIVILGVLRSFYLISDGVFRGGLVASIGAFIIPSFPLDVHEVSSGSLPEIYPFTKRIEVGSRYCILETLNSFPSLSSHI